MKSSNWLMLAFEFVIVTVGIVAGFQVTDWGEREGYKELAVQNLVRAIGETESNAEQLTLVVEQLEKSAVLIEPVLHALMDCDNDLTRNDIEKILVNLGFDFLANLESGQIKGLTRVEYTRFYSDNFLKELSTYLALHGLTVEGTLFNHQEHFDFQHELAALDEVTVLEGSPNDYFYKQFYLSANPDELCENPEAIKRLWRQAAYRDSNQHYYQSLIQGINDFSSVMRHELEAIK
jgi:hypothetical protein